MDPSGLMYMRARYYDPKTQQFLSRDDVTDQPYVYTGGNPVNATDPSGHCPFCVIAGLALLGIGVGVATDVGSDFVFDNAPFDLGTSLGNAFSDPLTYLGAIPVEGEISSVLRATAKGAAKSFAVRAGKEILDEGFGKITNLRGKSIQWLKRNKPKGWRTVPSDDRQGWKWLDRNDDERLRFERPTGNNPASDQWSRQSTGYLRWGLNENDLFDIDGNLVPRGHPDYQWLTHIPYEGPYP